MLNRRTLRIKVMQALYAYDQAVGSDFLLANDRIADAFAPDLNAPVPPRPPPTSGAAQIG